MADSIRTALERLVNAVKVYDATGMDVLGDAIAAARAALAEQQGETPTTDWKAICVELLAALKNAIRVVYHEDGTQHISTADPVIAKADAALASDGPAVPEGREQASVIEEPSDDELESVARAAEIQNMREQGGLSANDANGIQAQLQRQRLAGLRAVFDLGHQPSPPAEGEVRELVAKLRRLAPHNPLGTADPTITRAAELLQQQHPAPVPVSEGWPEFSDCERVNDQTWCFNPLLSHWKLTRIKQGVHTHWLPAHALPLPQGEAQP